MQRLAHENNADLNDEGARWAMRHHITALLSPWFQEQLADIAPLFDAEVFDGQSLDNKRPGRSGFGAQPNVC